MLIQKYSDIFTKRLSITSQKCSFCSIFEKIDHLILGFYYLYRMKEPKLMSLAHLRHILESHFQELREGLFINNEMAVLYGNSKIFRIIMQQQPPFSINDYRLGIILHGEIEANINLVEKHIMAGNLVFFGPGTILNPHRISEDFEICGFALSPNFPMPFAPGALPAAFNGQVRDFQLPASEADLSTARHIVDTLWQVVHQHKYSKEVVGSLVAAQLHLYDSLYRSFTDRQQTTQSREQTLFDRFIQLVNLHAAQQHQIAFYASRMCLTERYLGTVIRQASGVTAKEWIDRALILRIKVGLRHTDKSVAQISEEMNFPNPSFFSKYFKRLTGMTPAQYRQV